MRDPVSRQTRGTFAGPLCSFLNQQLRGRAKCMYRPPESNSINGQVFRYWSLGKLNTQKKSSSRGWNGSIVMIYWQFLCCKPLMSRYAIIDNTPTHGVSVFGYMPSRIEDEQVFPTPTKPRGVWVHGTSNCRWAGFPSPHEALWEDAFLMAHYVSLLAFESLCKSEWVVQRWFTNKYTEKQENRWFVRPDGGVTMFLYWTQSSGQDSGGVDDIA